MDADILNKRRPILISTVKLIIKSMATPILEKYITRYIYVTKKYKFALYLHTSGNLFPFSEKFNW